MKTYKRKKQENIIEKEQKGKKSSKKENTYDQGWNPSTDKS